MKEFFQAKKMIVPIFNDVQRFSMLAEKLKMI